LRSQSHVGDFCQEGVVAGVVFFRGEYVGIMKVLAVGVMVVMFVQVVFAAIE